MSFCPRHSAVLGLLVGSACLAAVGCSSDKNKQVRYVGEAGAGGEAGASVPAADAGAPPEATGATGGASAPSEAGQGGAPEAAAGAAGEAGALSAAGTGGVVASGGSAGSSGAVASGGSGGAITACQPSGDAYSVALDTPVGDAPKACRGAVVTNGFTGTADKSFTCCGTADVGYSVGVTGRGNGDGGGQVALIVPADAPLGAQSVSLTCAPGPVKYSVDINVTATLAPVVTGVVYNNGALTVSGVHLTGVTAVNAVLAGTLTFAGGSNCFINQSNLTDTSLSCAFDGISPGDYLVALEQADCGFAVNTPKFTVPVITQ